jgi:hypothetical protein
VVKVLPAPKTKEKAEQDSNGRDTKSSSDWWNVRITGALAIIALLQLGVYGYQSKKLSDTVESAKAQGAAMERHITEAARSAKAMETLASVITAGNRAITRAYLTVIIGEGVPQFQRGEGTTDLRFEARPFIVNTGNSPARRVSFKKSVAILPFPIPKEYNFPLPDEEVLEAGMIGAHQQFTITATLERYVPWEQVSQIRGGDGSALCVWGVVTYEDIFGNLHSTRFGQIITWQPNGNVVGYYMNGQNDGD